MPPSVCIGILNHLFFWPEQYRRTGGMSIVFLFDENPDVASAGSGGAAVGGARSVPDHAARSNSERAAPSARVGNRFSAPQIVWNKSNRRAGERGGARVGRPRWARILTITGGSSMSVLSRVEGAGDDLQAAAAVRAVFDVDVEGASFILHLLQWVCPRRWLLCSRQMRRARREVGIATRRGHCRCGP